MGELTPTAVSFTSNVYKSKLAIYLSSVWEAGKP